MVEAKFEHERRQWDHTAAIAYPVSCLLWLLESWMSDPDKELRPAPTVSDVHPYYDEIQNVGIAAKDVDAAKNEAARLNAEMQRMSMMRSEGAVKSYMERQRNE